MYNNLQLAQEYIRAIENGATGNALSRFFTPDVVIEEMPNRIVPRGSISDLTKALQGAERGKRIFARQTYRNTNLLADGNRVALEIDWLGVTAIPIQDIPLVAKCVTTSPYSLNFGRAASPVRSTMTVSNLGNSVLVARALACCH